MNDDALPPRGPTYWSRLVHTPLRDALRGRLTGCLDLQATIAAAALPRPLAELTRSLARRTRLWRVEQVDVARELIEHFRDGLAAGRTADQLLVSFGDVRQAARLIRRARLRARPLLWRLWRHGWQLAAATLVLAGGTYAISAIRLFSNHPHVAHNYQLDLIAPTQGVPEDQRAWPFYRRALMELTPVPSVPAPATESAGEPAGEVTTNPQSELPDVNVVPVDEAVERPGSERWPLVVKWLDENRAALEATRAGAARPKLGFVFNDPADRTWFESIGVDPGSMDPNKNGEVLGFILEHMHRQRRLVWLLAADARRALEIGDRQAFVDDVQALIGIADQLHSDLAFPVCDLLSFAWLRVVLDLIDMALEKQSELLTEADLHTLAHRAAGYADGGRIALQTGGQRLAVEDIMQRVYSDNGHGGGAVTAEGLKLLIDWRSIFGKPAPIEDDVLKEPSVWPALALLAPSRQAMNDLLVGLYDRLESQFNRPLWQWTRSELPTDIDRLKHSAIDRLFYGALFGSIDLRETYYYSELVAQQRDATLVALALVLYQRQHSAWPERLEQLVPDLLPAIPPDRFTGQPISYRLVDGQPLVYSVGPDRRDDGGRSLAHPLDVFKLTSLWPDEASGTTPPGDWVLWPLPGGLFAADPP